MSLKNSMEDEVDEWSGGHGYEPGEDADVANLTGPSDNHEPEVGIIPNRRSCP